MAGANYEVNIQLKADPALRSLERIEQKINKLTKTSVDLQDARGAAMVKNRNLADRINKLEEKGVKVGQMRERLGKAIAKTDKGSLQTAAAHAKILSREVKAEERLLQIKKDQLKVDRQQTRQKGPGRAQQAILGGGFPLLFGGSPLQAAAGAVGGAFGGFAGGIGAQAAVGQIENLFGKAAELGQGLNKLTFDLEAVTGAAGFANTETAQLLSRIEEYGDAAVAAKLATELLEKRIGGEGVKALKDFGEKAGELGRALSTIFTQVLAGIAKVAGPLLSSLAKFAGEQAAVGSFKARTDLKGVDEFARQILTGEGLPQGPGARKARILRKSREFGLNFKTETQAREFARGRAISSQKAFELPTIEAIKFEASQVQDPSQARDADRAERLAKQSEKRVKLLRIETNAVKRITEFKDRIAAAELAGDKQTAARIEGELKIFQIGVDQEKSILRINDNLTETQQAAEKVGIEQKSVAQVAEAQANTQRKIAKIIGEDQAKALKDLEKIYQGVGDIVKEGLVDGIQSAIRGTKSLTEVLSNMFDRLSNKFMDLAANIALYGNQQGTLSKGSGLFGSLFSAVLPALIPGSTSTNGLDVDLVQQYMYADGGFVNRPTNAVIGEGGESEYVIPSSKMNEAMGRYARGARGAAVIPEGDGVSPEGGMGGGSGVVDVRYSVERINNVDYVTAAEFERGMNQAAKRGAELGRQGVYSDLVNKRSIRSRVGV